MTEKCNSCDQMKKENTFVRKTLMETNKNYVEVVNENLELRKELEEFKLKLIETSNPGIDIDKVKESRISSKTKCRDCGGEGYNSVSMLHPSDPNQDYWIHLFCGRCGGNGYGRE